MNLWNDIVDLFFPRRCVGCGKKLIEGEAYVCMDCFLGLPLTHYHMEPDNDMEKNFFGKVPLVRAAAYYFYVKGSEPAKIIHAMKYKHQPKLAQHMGRCLANEVMASGFFNHVDVIVPIPLHAKRQKQRGYNQSEEMAKGLSEITGIPVAPDAVIREHETETQTRKSVVQRWFNMRDVFRCVNPVGLKGKHVLLVDDVMTTGATIVACADAMSAVENLQVSVLTLAVVKR